MTDAVNSFRAMQKVRRSARPVIVRPGPNLTFVITDYDTGRELDRFVGPVVLEDQADGTTLFRGGGKTFSVHPDDFDAARSLVGDFQRLSPESASNWSARGADTAPTGGLPPAAIASGDSASSLATIAGVLTAVAWALTFWAALSNRNEVADIANDSFLDPSAIQISQLADQAILDTVPFFVAACGLTAITIVLYGRLALRHLDNVTAGKST